MSGFASLLNQFKQSTEQAGKAPSIAPTSTRSPTEPKTYKCPTTAIKRIFVACPPIETGGPEALHQLCHVINSGGYQYEVKSEVLQALDVDEFGREIKKATGSEGANLGKVRAYMLYLRERHGAIAVAKDATRPTKYSQYDAPIADVLPGEGCALGQDGNSSDLLIFPEIWTKYIDALQPGANQHHDNASDCRSKRNKYQPAIWWLSVDNNRGAFSPKQFRERCDVLHLAQSNYARKYVTSNIIGIQSIPRNGQAKVLDLTEFIPYANSQSTAANLLSSSQEEVDKQIIECTQTTRDLDVLYNPLKGMHYTDEIIRRSGNKRAKTGVDGIAAAKSSIQFTPIGKGKGYKERLSGDEVFALLKRAKVYIDFGHHPGMDRLPREAALAGCIVLTNREGAANFDKDVPLPSELKFSSFDPDKIYSMLKDICSHSTKFDEYSKKMERYREWISGQQFRMRICIDRLIEECVTKREEEQQKEAATNK